MNRQTAKLIRGFTKIVGQSFRAHKKAYNNMSPKEKREAKVQLKRLWVEHESQGLLNHKKYYDLKTPLQPAEFTESSLPQLTQLELENISNQTEELLKEAK